jgi:hypothetical protein
VTFFILFTFHLFTFAGCRSTAQVPDREKQGGEALRRRRCERLITRGGHAEIEQATKQALRTRNAIWHRRPPQIAGCVNCGEFANAVSNDRSRSATTPQYSAGDVLENYFS